MQLKQNIREQSNTKIADLKKRNPIAVVFLLTVFLFGLLNYGNTQTAVNPIEYSFCLVDSTGQPVKSASARLNRKSGTIIQFLNLRDTNCTTIRFPAELDTVVLHISSMGFLAFEKKMAVRDSYPEAETIYLMWAPPSLPDAEIRAPVFTRGDTTFYNPEAFASGDEKKLKELLERLPDFRIDERGVMRYKNKPIEKIMIENEELFGDKTELLMSSIPVHVLGQIQAIENQINNPVLRGFEQGNKVFINLRLKKGVQAAFGDAIVAAGLPDRYKIAPTLFLLKNRVKAGLIANYNNLGEGFDWRQQQESRDNNQAKFESWMMHTNPLRIINNFDSRNYIRNRLASNRLQVNFPLGPKTVMQQEFGYIQDKQRQERTSRSEFIDSISTLLRTDTTGIINFPKILASRTQLKRLNGDSGQLLMQFNFYADRGSFSDFTRFKLPGEPAGNFRESIGKNYRQFNLFLNHTRRVSASRAKDFLLTVGHTTLSQEGLAYSPRMPQLFNLLEDLHYQSMFPKANVFYAYGGGSLFRKIGGRTRKVNLELNTNRYQYSNEAWFSRQENSKEQPFEGVNAQHVHWFHQALANMGWGGRNDQGWQYNFNLHMGAESIQSSMDKYDNRVAPAGKLNLRISHRIVKGFYAELTMIGTRSYKHQYKMLNTVRPSSMSNFIAYEGYSRRPELDLWSIWSLRYRPNIKTYYYLAFNFLPNFATPAFFQAFNGFVRTETDSLTSRSTLGTGWYFNYSFDDPFKKLSINFSASRSVDQFLYLWENQLQTRNMQSRSFNFHIVKTWDKFTLRAASRGYQAKNATKAKSNHVTVFSSWNVSHELNATIRPINGFHLIGKIQYFDGKTSTSGRTNFWWSDLETQWRPAGKKFYVTLDARNLFNTGGYYLNNTFQSMVSSTSLPFIRRNFLIGYYRTI